MGNGNVAAVPTYPVGALTTMVAIPAGAFTTTTTFTYTGFTTLARLPDLPGQRFAGRGFTLTAYQWGALQADFTFHQPVTITATYSDVDVVILDETTLGLYWRDGVTWRTDGLVTQERDVAHSRLVFTTAHLT